MGDHRNQDRGVVVLGGIGLVSVIQKRQNESDLEANEPRRNRIRVGGLYHLDLVSKS